MTKTFGTNANNDIFLNSQGNIQVDSGIPAIASAAETATKAQLGEMVLAINNGIPNFEFVWVGSPNLSAWEAYIKTTLQSVSGVQAVKSLSTRFDNDTLSYTATIQTAAGEVTVNG